MTTPTAIYKVNNLIEPLIEVNEFKKSLIVWAQNQATGQRTQAAIANRKHSTDKHLAKAETYDMLVIYLQRMEIKECS